MWAYEQRTGRFSRNSQSVSFGYSGHGDGKNNPDRQAEHNVGPIPRGSWKFRGPPKDTPFHGPYVLELHPCEGTEIFGRGGFLVHGDSIAHAGEASQGCIILAHWVRELIWQSGDWDLEVVA